MRFAFFGDVVGKSGRDGLADHLPALRRQLGLEFVIINAENAAAGFGITENTARELFEAGADCLTLGNHSWDQREALTYIVREPRLIRPPNYPILSDAPGRGSHLFQTEGGRTHHGDQPAGPGAHGRHGRPVRRRRPRAGQGSRWARWPTRWWSTCTARPPPRRWPWATIATAAPAWWWAPTPTCRPPTPRSCRGGTAYQTDAGACADYDSVIGNQKEEPLRRFTTKISGGRYQPASGPATVCGVFVETDDRTGLAVRVEPIRVGGRLKETIPEV